MKKELLKVYVVGASKGYARWIDCELVNTIEQADIVLFTGGEDINPEIYGEVAHPTTYFNEARDKFEIEAYRDAVKQGKFLVGICRGAQLICALQPKGRLIQDQTNPGNHTITIEGKDYRINSLHHQAMYPFEMDSEDYQIIASTQNESKHHKNGLDEEMNPPVECEIVYFNKVRALCIQHHPEMMGRDCETNIYLRDLLNKLLNS